MSRPSTATAARDDAPRSATGRRRWQNLALIGASACVAIVGAEIAVRLIAPQEGRFQTPGMYQPDSAVGYRFTPGYSGQQSNRIEYRVAIRTDEQGLRIPASGSRSARPRRWLMIGDSFVFGQGVEAEQALPAQLERALEARAESVSVLNAGVPGYSTRDQVEALRQRAPVLRPELVILGVYLGNDLQDNRIPGVERYLNGTVTYRPRRWHSAVSEWAFDNSHLYALLRSAPDALRASRRTAGLRADVLAIARRYRPSDDPAHLEELAATRRAIAAFDSLLSSSGIPGFAVLMPDALQADPGRMAALQSQLPDSLRMDFDYPNAVFARLLEQHGIPYVDLTGPMRAAAARGASLYYPVDRHWNRDGNALAAQLVADAIVEHRTRHPATAGDAAAP